MSPSNTDLYQRFRGRVYRLFVDRNWIGTYRKVRSARAARSLERGFARMSRQLRTLTPTPDRPTVLITGILSVPKKEPLLAFLAGILRTEPSLRLVLLDEREGKMQFPGDVSVDRVCFPASLDFRRYIPNSCIEPTVRDEELARKYPSIDRLTLDLTSRQQDREPSGIRRLICAYADIYEQAFELLKPKAVLIWCEFTKTHPLCAEIARAHGVRPLYIEFGSLPGTYALDSRGQMGESRVAMEHEAFRALPVTDEELARADEILTYLKGSGLNRNAQEDSDQLTQLRQILDQDGRRPLVLFAGQNDFDCGTLPWDDRARACHMPIYPDSAMAARALNRICQAEGWNFVYKPHPFLRNRVSDMEPYSVVRECNFNALIDMADVVVTGVSQSGYVALIRDRACVTVGYNQLRGKGCTYEVDSADELRETLREAVRTGRTPEQREAFRRHTAQMLRYALYDDGKARDLRFGRTPEEAARWLMKEIEEA